MPSGHLNCDLKLAMRLQEYADEIGKPASAIINELLEVFLSKADELREVEERTRRYSQIADEIFKMRNPKALRTSETSEGRET